MNSSREMSDGEQAFAGRISADGKLNVPLTEFKYEALKKTETTPHTVAVTSAGRVVTKTVTMDAKKSIRIEPRRGRTHALQGLRQNGDEGVRSGLRGLGHRR